MTMSIADAAINLAVALGLSAVIGFDIAHLGLLICNRAFVPRGMTISPADRRVDSKWPWGNGHSSESRDEIKQTRVTIRRPRGPFSSRISSTVGPRWLGASEVCDGLRSTLTRPRRAPPNAWRCRGRAWSWPSSRPFSSGPAASRLGPTGPWCRGAAFRRFSCSSTGAPPVAAIALALLAADLLTRPGAGN
jgi:hypothetical protein